MMEATVETALAACDGEGDLLKMRFNFSKVGEVDFGARGSKWSGKPVTYKQY